MAKNITVPSLEQLTDNPAVLIRYSPENAPALLASNAMKALAKVQSVKSIESARSLEAASAVIADVQITAQELDTFLDNLRAAIQKACERVREVPGYEDFEGSFTCRKWSLRSLITDGLRRLKDSRARFISDENERVRRENLAKQAEQDRINREAANKAAAEARKQGADKQTVAEIKQTVLATPAPIVTSRAVESAKESGVSLRYSYTAEITSLKSFLGACLSNDVLFNTLTKAIPDIEKAFRGMATDQKELFKFPGMTFKKTPVDIGRRGA